MFQKVTFYCLSLGILNIGYFSCQGSYKGDSFAFRNGTMIYHTYSGKIFRWFWIESINFWSIKWSLLLLRSSFWIFLSLIVKACAHYFYIFQQNKSFIRLWGILFILLLKCLFCSRGIYVFFFPLLVLFLLSIIAEFMPETD